MVDKLQTREQMLAGLTTPANGEQVERARVELLNELYSTPTEDARERVKVLEEALLRIAETDRHTRRVKCNPNGGLRGQAGMIAVFALTGKNGSHLTDADVRTALGNKETDRHG